MQDIAVEAAFPQSAVTRMWDIWVEANEYVMSGLEEGRMYCDEGGGWLTAGSQAEKLALEDSWGHRSADIDRMVINGGPMGVYVAGGQEPRGQSCLEFSPQGCLLQGPGH